MGNVLKLTASQVYGTLSHNVRSGATHKNKDIDITKSDQNIRLSPDWGMSDYDHYKEIIKDYHYMKRKDVVHAVSWVFTAPKDLSKENEIAFFKAVRTFLNERYGADHELQCIIHKDEIHKYADEKTGLRKESRTHMHYMFVPAVADKKHGGEKICCKQVINRKELMQIHKDLQEYINGQGLNCSVYTGITKEQGNKTVDELKKKSSQIKYERERMYSF